MQEFTRGESLCCDDDPSTWRSVVLAVHTSGTPIALKTAYVWLKPDQQEQVLSEIDMLQNSDHPSFCRFYGCTYSEQEDGYWSGLYLGQEYCEVRCDPIESATSLPSSHSDHRYG